jgi:hypothetical protein
MPNIDFRFAWQKPDLAFVRDAKAFWNEIGAIMTPAEIDERVSQLCALAYEGGQVTAISTVHLFDYPRLRSRFFYYRTAVGPNFRRRKLASRLCVYSRDRLAEWSREHPEQKMKGLFIVLQAEEFQSREHAPVIAQLDLRLILVGYTPNGYRMRVEWFSDASVE